MATSRGSHPSLLDEEVRAEALGVTRQAGGPVALGIGILLAWEGAVWLLDVAPHFLPAPTLIAAELFDGLRQGFLIQHAAVTALEMAAGFLAAAVLGIGLAIVVDRSERLRSLIQPYIVVIQATPKIALAPFLVIWFGFGMPSKIANAALVAFFPIFVNTLAGFSSVSVRVLDLMSVYRARPRHVLWKAKFPHALPYVFAGLEIGILMSLIGAVVAEFVSSTVGLGYLIANYNFQLKTAAAFAALVILVVLGTVSYGAILLLKRRIVFWIGKI
jgi:NitT/TauT family transport system permease protein